MPLEHRCSSHRFSYKGLGQTLQTETAIRKGSLCCYYGGKDYSAEDKAVASAMRKQAHPDGGFRVAAVPPTTSCGVAQLAMDRHRIVLAHPTSLSSVLRAVRDYEKAAVADNTVRPVEDEPFAYYAVRDLQPGDEVSAAFGTAYWLAALGHAEERPATRLLLCIAAAQYEHMMMERESEVECTSLRAATGATLEFVFSTKTQAITLRGGAAPSQMEAGGFIVKFLRVGVKSAFWAPFAQPDDGADEKLRKLVRHLVKDGQTVDSKSEWED